MTINFNKQSVKYQLFILELILVCILALSSIFLVIRFKSEIDQQSESHSSIILEEARLNINTNLRSFDSIALNVSINSDIHDLVYMNNYADDYEKYLEAELYIHKQTATNPYINRICIVTQNRKIYFSDYDTVRLSSIDSLTKNLPKSSKLQYLDLFDTKQYNERELIFGLNIFDDTYSHIIGQVVLFINPAVFLDNINVSDGQLFITNNKQQIAFSNNFNDIGEFISRDINSNDDWYLNMPFNLNHIKRNYFSQNTLVTGIIYLILVLIILILIILIYFFISRNMVAPLDAISKFISNINHGDLRQLTKRIDSKGPKEVQIISNEINNLFDEVHSLSHRLVKTTSRLYTIELEKNKAELNYLKSQVNPHFLYNTLGIIQGIATLHGEDDIVAINRALVKMFRYSIKGEDIVQLKQEIDICKSYIAIQLYRFENRFHTEYIMNDPILEIPIQKMLLQPLIENAIIHGIEPILRQTKLTIVCKRLGNQCLISIEDNGKGIPSDHLKNIQELLISSSKGYNKEHIGIYNVNARLVNYYGAESALHIESHENKGTKVYFTIPINA